MLYRQRQASVSGERLIRLLTEHEGEQSLVEHRPVHFREPAPAAPAPPAVDDPFERLEVEGLSAHHPTSGRGIDEVDLVVRRGELVVVTGAVGSGKTTLLRAVLGLVSRDGGAIRWNGQLVDDPGVLLVPPRTAYAAQVPRLWSAPLRENLLLGWDASDDDIERCVASGAARRRRRGHVRRTRRRSSDLGACACRAGQLQRALAARALVRQPELLVVDDLSSALDVETEHALWHGLAGRSTAGGSPAALLVVSHRPSVLERADRVITLDEGRVAQPPRHTEEIPA